MAAFLACFDVESIQRYIFSTARLREIRGASVLLADANSRLPDTLRKNLGSARVCPVVDTAGVAKMIVEAEGLAVRQVEQAAQAAAAQFVTDTVSATVVWHVEPLDEFPDCLKRAEAALRAKKNARGQAPRFASHPLFRLCDVCGQWSATQLLVAPGNAEAFEYLCDACVAKSRFGRRQTADGSALERVEDGVRRGFRDWLCERDERDREVQLPHELGGVAARSLRDPAIGDPRAGSETRFIGVLYADGNRMGKVWQSPHLDQDYYGFLSAGIRRATEQGLVKAVLKVAEATCEEERNRQDPSRPWTVPFVPLMVGGDDVACVTAGTWALDVAAAFHQCFQAELQSDEREALRDLCQVPLPGMSVGVVLVKAHYPIRQALDLAKDLLRNAKRRNRSLPVDAGGTDPGTVDFAVVMDTAVRDIQRTRSDDFRVQTGEIELTERPYLVDNENGCTYLTLPALLEATASLHTPPANAEPVPRSKLKRLVEVLRLPDQVRGDAYAEWLRSLRPEQQSTWAGACRTLGLPEDADGHNRDFCRQVDEAGATKTSGILDVIEVLDILAKG